jgi:1-acyl-sn-glycerol-3-phosphate acyltransferase
MYYRIYEIPLLKFIFKTGKAIPIASRTENPQILEQAYERMHQVLQEGDVLGVFPEGRITSDGEINTFRPGIDRIIARQPVPVVPMALCNLWGSLFSRRDPLHKRRPYKFWANIELRIGKPIAPEHCSAEALQQAVEALRGADR